MTMGIIVVERLYFNPADNLLSLFKGQVTTFLASNLHFFQISISLRIKSAT